MALEISEHYREYIGNDVPGEFETPSLISFHFQWLIDNHGRKGLYMELETTLEGESHTALQTLRPKEDRTLSLACGLADRVHRCTEAIRRATDLYIEDERIGKLKGRIKQVEDKANELKNFLSLVIERRTFQGTCSICADWAT